MNEHELPLLDDEGRKVAALTISALPGKEQWADQPAMRFDPDAEFGAPLQLIEECSYRYRFKVEDGEAVQAVEPSELFGADSADALSGRLATGRATGTIQILLLLSGGRVGRAEFEVRSRKLHYETEYRRMMARIADEGAELVQSAFATASFSGFDPSGTASSATLYQRFAFIAAELESEGFAEAMDVIRNRPHSEFRTTEEEIHPGLGAQQSRGLVKQLISGGPRRDSSVPVAGMMSVPRTLRRGAHVTTYDTLPNQFVRFALEHWRSLTVEASRLLKRHGAEARRGRLEAELMEAKLESYLTIPAIADAGPLTQLPVSNTVLGSRAGYREVFRAFLLSDAAASLTWEGGNEVFGAGQRDVAMLYEYWVFLEIARIIESIPGFAFDRRSLVRTTENGLNLDLRSGREVVLSGTGRTRGRKVDLQLWFNRTFSAGGQPDGSWTVEMRPDCSLRIDVEGPVWPGPTWVHFDAKYRIAQYREFFGADSDAGSTEASSGPKTDDLRKMHAYRDAIRRTSGAYVVYPGDDSQIREPDSQYHEILPGLGAFVLRPGESGEATSQAGDYFKRFLVDVIDHAAAQGTARERTEYWRQRSYETPPSPRRDFEPGLEAPVADTNVLLGFVRSPVHWAWIESESIYNLRADPGRRGSVGLDSPALRADVVLLYDEVGELAAWRTSGAVFVRSRAELADSGYPISSPPESLYLCLELSEQIAMSLSGDDVRRVAGSAVPAAMTWAQLLDAVDGIG